MVKMKSETGLFIAQKTLKFVSIFNTKNDSKVFSEISLLVFN